VVGAEIARQRKGVGVAVDNDHLDGRQGPKHLHAYVSESTGADDDCPVSWAELSGRLGDRMVGGKPGVSERGDSCRLECGV
jgi:hypothetical protein